MSTSTKVRVKCTRCNGLGEIEQYMHVAEGMCFGCGGTGFEEITKRTAARRAKPRKAKPIPADHVPARTIRPGDIISSPFRMWFGEVTVKTIETMALAPGYGEEVEVVQPDGTTWRIGADQLVKITNRTV